MAKAKRKPGRPSSGVTRARPDDEENLPKSLREKRDLVDQFTKARSALQYGHSLLRNWRKLIKGDGFASLHYARQVEFMGHRDRPVDMAEVWNWMIKADRRACKVFHAAVTKALKGSNAAWSKEIKELSR